MAWRGTILGHFQHITLMTSTPCPQSFKLKVNILDTEVYVPGADLSKAINSPVSSRLELSVDGISYETEHASRHLERASAIFVPLTDVQTFTVNLDQQ